MIAASMTYYVGFSFMYYFLLWPLMFEWTIAFPMENRVWIPSKNSRQANTSDCWDWDINWWHPLVVLFYNQDPDLGGTILFVTTATIAIINLVLFLLPGYPPYWQATTRILGKMYSNMMMAVLNNRIVFKTQDSETITSNESLNVFDTSSTTGVTQWIMNVHETFSAWLSGQLQAKSDPLSTFTYSILSIVRVLFFRTEAEKASRVLLVHWVNNYILQSIIYCVQRQSVW